jgi:Bifunctional DNA primase/polymerase, N-terminal
VSRSDAALTLKFAAFYAARGLPLLVCHPRSKKPIGELVPHAAHSATTDLTRIRRWLARCPDANLAVACGAPGPQVLDLDYPDRAPGAVLAAARRAPRVRSYRTDRSGHAYFAGTDQGTLEFEYGELRGCGSYAMVPPSIHPSGRRYVWVAEPRGPLPAVPLVRATRRAGCGEHKPPVRLIADGEGRHLYLKDAAARLARGGLVDVGDVEAVLEVLFGRRCEPLPPPRRGEFRSLAEWAARSDIAGRERARDEFARWVARNEINEEERRRNGG